MFILICINQGYEVFKNNPILGVGNKNYRIETCAENIKQHKNKDVLCLPNSSSPNLFRNII